LACIAKVTFAVADNVKLICAWPVEVSVGAAKFWLAPLFGHTMNWPPEAAASFCTANGANRLWPERLSSSTTRLLLPPEDELALLEDEELLDELEELELEELVEPVVEELALLLEELLLDEELEDELEELVEPVVEELELLLEPPPSPAQVGAAKLPSCVP
jgi:hypothetical protein